MMTKADGETATKFPKSARLRNLTYSAPLYVDVSYSVVDQFNKFHKSKHAEFFLF